MPVYYLESSALVKYYVTEPQIAHRSDRTIITRAAALCLKHPMRGFDAIHLASGLSYRNAGATGNGVDVLPSRMSPAMTVCALPRPRGSRWKTPSGTPIWIPRRCLDFFPRCATPSP